MRPRLHALLELIVSSLQMNLSQLPFTDFVAESMNDFIQAQLLPSIGLPEGYENDRYQEASDNPVNLRGTRRPEGMARIDKPIEDSDEAKDCREDCRRIPAHQCAVGLRDINRNVEGDTPQDRIKEPAQKDGENSRQCRNRVSG